MHASYAGCCFFVFGPCKILCFPPYCTFLYCSRCLFPPNSFCHAMIRISPLRFSLNFFFLFLGLFFPHMLYQPPFPEVMLIFSMGLSSFIGLLLFSISTLMFQSFDLPCSLVQTYFPSTQPPPYKQRGFLSFKCAVQAFSFVIYFFDSYP